MQGYSVMNVPNNNIEDNDSYHHATFYVVMNGKRDGSDSNQDDG